MRQELSIPSQLKYLREVEIFVQRIVDTYHLPGSLQGYFMLSVLESVNNAIAHGNQFDMKKYVHITVYNLGAEINIEVEDEGDGFDYTNIPDPTNKRFIKNEHGRGLFLIKSLSDDVKFLNNGSKIQIKFKLDREHQLLFRGD